MSANIVIRCPECRRFAPGDKARCLCGQTLRNFKLRDWWLDLTGKENPRPGTARTRQRIGLASNRMAAQTARDKLVTAITEGRHIERDKADVLTLAKLQAWQVNRPETKALRSYPILLIQLDNVVQRMGSVLTVARLTETHVSEYRAHRGAEGIKPATINKEVGQLAAALNAAVRAKLLHRNPLSGLGKLAEDNARDFTIEPPELEHLLAECRKTGIPWLAPLVEVAYFTLMRQGECLSLTWDRVRLDAGYLRLRGVDTKNKEGRLVTLHPRAKQALLAIKPAWPKGWVFQDTIDQPISRHALAKGFRRAVVATGLRHEDYGWFRFHDLRHCGAEHYDSLGSHPRAVMSLGGWKTDSMRRRYVTKSQAKEQAGLVFSDTKVDTRGQN